MIGVRHIFRAGGFSIFKPRETQFFIDVITTTLRNRMAQEGSKRNDLIDMMIKAMKEEIGGQEEEEVRFFDILIN